MITGRLFFSILLFYAILIGVNLPAPLLGLRFEDGPDERFRFAPPGYVIPIVWFVLFTLLGAAHHLVTESNDAPRGAASLIVGLGVLCAAYAYYTLGLAALTGVSALWFGLAGNLAVIAAAVYVAWSLYPFAPAAAYLTAPVAVWTAFATLIVVAEIKANELP